MNFLSYLYKIELIYILKELEKKKTISSTTKKIYNDIRTFIEKPEKNLKYAKRLIIDSRIILEQNHIMFSTFFLFSLIQIPFIYYLAFECGLEEEKRITIFFFLQIFITGLFALIYFFCPLLNRLYKHFRWIINLICYIAIASIMYFLFDIKSLELIKYLIGLQFITLFPLILLKYKNKK